MSYTKGPWQYDENMGFIFEPISGKIIGEAYESDVMPLEELNANVALMVSAPEQQEKIDALLAVCKRALVILSAINKLDEQRNIPLPVGRQYVCDNLRDAIAKAES